MSKANFTFKNPLLFSALFGAGACAGGPYQAPMGSVVSISSDVNLAPSQAYILRDAIGSLIIADALVYDESTSVPLNNVEVQIRSGSSGVYVLPEASIKFADYPSPPDGVETWDDIQAACDTDGDNYIDNDADDWCSWWWNMESDQYYQITGEYSSGDEMYAPNVMIGGTNGNGYLRFYIFVDQMPAEDEEGNTYLTDVSQVSDWYAVDVTVSIGVDDETFTIAVTAV